MTYCKDCNSFIEDDVLLRSKNTVPYGLGEVLESVEVECPNCKSNNLVRDVDEMYCSLCGKAMLAEDAYEDPDDDLICKHCYEMLNELIDDDLIGG